MNGWSDDARSNVHHNRKEVVKAVGILHIIHGVKETQLHRKGDPVCEFDVPSEGFLIFKTLQMKRKDIGQFLDLHSIEEWLS